MVGCAAHDCLGGLRTRRCLGRLSPFLAPHTRVRKARANYGSTVLRLRSATSTTAEQRQSWTLPITVSQIRGECNSPVVCPMKTGATTRGRGGCDSVDDIDNSRRHRCTLLDVNATHVVRHDQRSNLRCSPRLSTSSLAPVPRLSPSLPRSHCWPHARNYGRARLSGTHFG